MATRPSAQALANAARAVSDDKPRRNRRTKPEAANAPPPPPTEKRAAPRPKPKRRPNRARRDDGASAAAEAVVARDPRAVVAAEAPRSAEVSPGILDAWVATQLRRGVKPSIPDAMGYLRSVGVNLRQLDDDRRQAWLDAIEATVDRAAAADDVSEAAEAPAEAPAVIVVEAPVATATEAPAATSAEAPAATAAEAPAAQAIVVEERWNGDRPEAPAAQAIVVEERWKPLPPRRRAKRPAKDSSAVPAPPAPADAPAEQAERHRDDARPEATAQEAPDEPTEDAPAGGDALPDEDAAVAAVGASLARARAAIGEDEALASARAPGRRGAVARRRSPRTSRSTAARQRAAEALYAEAERVLRDMEQQESLDRRVARQGAFFTHRLSKGRARDCWTS
ncbi:hypothetical protein SO694_00132037 [Aureococcus anophagefferens]|uniref:Uncharacterized protein n=1 Tax=Aureococcus anophagefferens TaxID=44056 RepID=A0ABR1GFR2_AURAN